MKRIAVWNTAFLGDAVLTLPLIQTLADAFPGSEIDFYVRRGACLPVRGPSGPPCRL